MILGLHRQYNFDIVIVEYVFFSKALTYFPPGVFKIIDTHDVFTDRHKMFLKNNIRPKWYSTTRREEKKGLERADLVIAIQDSERSFFSGMVRVPVITVGHLTPTRPPKERGNSYKILYVASRNPNNLQSITWFLDEVLDRVSRAVPDVELLIAGTVCNELPDRERVTKLGIVDELGAAYDMADLVINPMLYGTGLKIKNVEALGYAKALVTTPVGAEGMEDGKDTSFLVASDPDEFSECIIRLFRDADLYTSLTRSAYEYALRWNESTLGALKNAIDAIPPRR